MLKSLIIRGRQTFINVGCVNPMVRLNRLKLKLMTLFMILIFASGCSEFALLASGVSIGASQNAYVKAYNGIDVLTIMRTEKDIKTHVYKHAKELYEKTKY
jgi:hypothetical protein